MYLKELCVEETSFWWSKQNTSGHSEEAFAIQTSKLVISIEDEKRRDILEKAGIYPAVITPENLVAMKADLGISWEKPKCLAR